MTVPIKLINKIESSLKTRNCSPWAKDLLRECLDQLILIDSKESNLWQEGYQDGLDEFAAFIKDVLNGVDDEFYTSEPFKSIKADILSGKPFKYTIAAAMKQEQPLEITIEELNEDE